MCRRHQMYGCCMLAFGLGMMLGLWWKSWLFCGFGGLCLCVFGVWIMRSR